MVFTFTFNIINIKKFILNFILLTIWLPVSISLYNINNSNNINIIFNLFYIISLIIGLMLSIKLYFYSMTVFSMIIFPLSINNNQKLDLIKIGTTFICIFFNIYIVNDLIYYYQSLLKISTQKLLTSKRFNNSVDQDLYMEELNSDTDSN